MGPCKWGRRVEKAEHPTKQHVQRIEIQNSSPTTEYAEMIQRVLCNGHHVDCDFHLFPEKRRNNLCSFILLFFSYTVFCPFLFDIRAFTLNQLDI